MKLPLILLAAVLALTPTTQARANECTTIPQMIGYLDAQGFEPVFVGAQGDTQLHLPDDGLEPSC